MIWIGVTNLSEKGEQLSKFCVRRIRRCLKEDVKFNILYDTKKVSIFCSSKDKISINQKAITSYTSSHVHDAIRPILAKQTDIFSHV